MERFKHHMAPNSGMIKDLAIPWLFQELVIAAKTGTVVCGLDKTVKKVYMAKGEIVFASSSLIEDRLGESMVRTNAITREQRDKSLNAALQQGKKLGALLIENELITPKQLVAGVKHQVRQITASIFNLYGGFYIFDESPLPDIIPIRLDTWKLIADSIQNVAWDVVRRVFPASVLKTAVQAADATSYPIHNVSLDKDQRVMLSLIDGTKSIGTLCNSSGLGDFNALKAIYVLLASKIARLCEAASAE